MDRFVARCFFLDAVSLKELGRDEEALLAFTDVCKSQSSDVEQWMKALALTHMAEIHGRQGRYSKAAGALAEAWDLLKVSSVPSALAHFHGVRGEILRDSGCFEEAAESYSLASSVYASCGMRGFEAYVRVLRAETLFLANRGSDAVVEIMAALPAIEALGLMREGMTALALLRESLKGQEADRNALGALKQELQNLNGGGRS
jgi:tetratricopeptide (TPR) repeat protein